MLILDPVANLKVFKRYQVGRLDYAPRQLAGEVFTLALHLAIFIQVIAGCSLVFHPQLEALILNKTGSLNSFINSLKLLLGSIKFYLKDNHLYFKLSGVSYLIMHE